MSNLVYSNFKNGYDTRRSELTTQPGALLQLQDAVVNEGAEIEKRKAFLNASFKPVNCFGLETTANGLFTFSSGYLICGTASRARDVNGIVTIVLKAATYDNTGNYVLTLTPRETLLWTPGANDLTLVNGATTLYAAKGAQHLVNVTTSVTFTGTPNSIVTATLTYPGFPLIQTIVPGSVPAFGVNAEQADGIMVQATGDASVNGSWTLLTQVGSTITFQTLTVGSAYSTTVDAAGKVYWAQSFFNNTGMQTLLHPAVTDGATYNPALHDMTSVACSTSFGGAAWVTATYKDSNSFVFWNGNYVPAFRNGQVLSGLDTTTFGSNAGIAGQLQNYINSLQLSGFLVNAVQTVGGASFFYVYAPVGQQMTLLANPTSRLGTLVPTQISLGYQAVTGVPSNNSFTITAGTTGSITGVYTSLDAYATNLLQSTVNFTTTPQQLAIDVSVSIATNPNKTVIFSAVANQSTVILTDKTNSGTTPNGAHLKIVVTGDICIDNVPFCFGPTWTVGDDVTNIKWDSTGVNQEILYGQNIVPTANYSGGGSYSLSGIVVGATYMWGKGANDTNLVNGSTTLTTSGSFTATTATTTLHGTGSTSITAVVIASQVSFGATDSLTTFLQRIANVIQNNNIGYTAAIVPAVGSQVIGSANLYISRTTVNSATNIAAMDSAITYTSATGTLTNGLSGGTTSSTAPISVTIQPQMGAYHGMTPGSTQYLTALVNGGSPPFAFMWTIVSGGPTSTTDNRGNVYQLNYISIIDGLTSPNVLLKDNFGNSNDTSGQSNYLGGQIAVTVLDYNRNMATCISSPFSF